VYRDLNAEDRRTKPSRTSLRGLDWFTFFVADIQTGFGPFIAVYLTTQKWTLADIGLVLTIGGLVGLVGQMPGGAVVDAVRSERRAAAVAVIGIGVSALVLALWPIFIIVVAARVLHAASSCVLGPALAAISLGLVGHAAIGERLGRNARFASVGNGLSAAVMGAVGYLSSRAAVFFVAAAERLAAIVAEQIALDLGDLETGVTPSVAANDDAPALPEEHVLERLHRHAQLLVLGVERKHHLGQSYGIGRKRVGANALRLHCLHDFKCHR
jgi:Major Facilitator Superfamily